MNDRRCRATKADGTPCASTIITADGLCRSHSPRYTAARKRSASKAGSSTGDPEMREILDVLRALRLAVDRGEVDTDKADLLVRIDRARIYAAKADAEIRRHAAEVLELEEHAAELEDAIEELQQEMDRGMRRR
jgi:hypothetical protein